jgi:hypothetical protein
MKFTNAIKFYRKSGGSPTIAFARSIRKSREGEGKHSKHIFFGPRTLRRTWGTRPTPQQFLR